MSLTRKNWLHFLAVVCIGIGLILAWFLIFLMLLDK